MGHLSSKYGGDWQIESLPDELYPNEPSPEVVATNGEISAGIEVKRLTGDAIHQAYEESLWSNQKFLTPSCGGYYSLNPPVDLRLPMELDLRRLIKREIERVAPTLEEGQSGVLRVPRHGLISVISKDGPPYVMCHHGGPHYDLLVPLGERIDGKLGIVDEGLEHSFFTEEGREQFYDSVKQAYERTLVGETGQCSWNEEWELFRTEDEEDEEDEDEKDGVRIICATEAFGVQESVLQTLSTVLDSGLKKFATKRWANVHVLVFEASLIATASRVNELLSKLEASDMPDIELILIVEGDEIFQGFPEVDPIVKTGLGLD